MILQLFPIRQIVVTVLKQSIQSNARSLPGTLLYDNATICKWKETEPWKASSYG